MKRENTAHPEGLEQGLPSGGKSITSVDNMDDVNLSDVHYQSLFTDCNRVMGKEEHHTQKLVDDFKHTTTSIYTVWPGQSEEPGS